MYKEHYTSIQIFFVYTIIQNRSRVIVSSFLEQFCETNSWNISRLYYLQKQ